MFVISFSRNPSRIIVPKYFFSPKGNDIKFKKASARSPAEVDVMAFKKKNRCLDLFIAILFFSIRLLFFWRRRRKRAYFFLEEAPGTMSFFVVFI